MYSQQDIVLIPVDAGNHIILFVSGRKGDFAIIKHYTFKLEYCRYIAWMEFTLLNLKIFTSEKM